MSKVVKKLLSNAQDLEIYLSVEGKLGREKVTRAAMARKYHVKPGVAESGYKRGKKLYDTGERPDAKIVEHTNDVTAIEGDKIVPLDQLLIGSIFKVPGDKTRYTAYGIDRECASVLTSVNPDLAMEIKDGVELVSEDSTISEIYVALTQIGTLHPGARFKIEDYTYVMDPETLDMIELLGIVETTDGVEQTLSEIYHRNSRFKDAVYGCLSALNAENVDNAIESSTQTDEAKAKKVKSTNLEGVTDYPTIVNTTMALIVKDGKNHQIPASHPNFDKVCTAITERRWENAIDMMSIPKALSQLTLGRITVTRGNIEFDGEPLEHDGFAKRILAMMEGGEAEPLERLVKFLDKVMDNPSNNIVKRIFDFMKFNDIEIGEDGDIFVFKAVNSAYRDCHSNKIDNSVGAVVKMRRNRVNENQDQTCSYGLHVCALSYLPSYAGTNGAGNRILKCKLNPCDIVSVPTDYKDAKIRCCKYVVIEDVTKAYRSNKIKIDMNGVFSVS